VPYTQHPDAVRGVEEVHEKEVIEMPAGLRSRIEPGVPEAPTEAAPASRPRRGETIEQEAAAVTTLLLACGIVAPLVYLASDVIAGMRWEGYSFRDQTISELNAIGSPTRALTIALGLAGYTVLIGFGVGVWRSARLNRRLRVAGGALVAIGVLSLFAVPFASMHVREAEESLTDTLHVGGGAVVGLLLLVVIGFGAGAFGTGYRLYSVATVLVMFAFLGWTATDSAAMTDNLATPWLGVVERVWVYAYQLWLVVFAIAVLRRHLAPGAGPGRRP
jgi:hypothetical protein